MLLPPGVTGKLNRKLWAYIIRKGRPMPWHETAYVFRSAPMSTLSHNAVLQGKGSLKRGRSPASPDLDLGDALVAGRCRRASLPADASLAVCEEPRGAEGPAAESPGVFAGLRFVFWVDRFSSKLRAG